MKPPAHHPDEWLSGKKEKPYCYENPESSFTLHENIPQSPLEDFFFFSQRLAGSSELENWFIGLIIKSIFTVFILVGLGSKPCCIAAQWAASWSKGHEILSSHLLFLCFIKDFHLRDNTDPLRAKHTATPEQLAQVLLQLPSSGIDSLAATSSPPRSCNPRAI